MGGTQLVDFPEITAEEQSKMVALHAQFIRSMNGHIDGALEMGEVLEQAQLVLADHSSGTFCRYIDQAWGVPKSTAYDYIAAHRGRNLLVRVPGQLPCLGALKALGSEKAPPEAIEEAAKIIQNGEPLTEADAKQIVKDFLPDPEPQKPAQAVAAINPQSRKAASNAVYVLMRALAVLGIDDEFDASLSQILTKLEKL
jgi:hypothetical protein